MSPDEFRAAAHQAVDWIADYLRDIRDFPVLPDVQPGDLIDRLPAAGPEQGESMDAILADFRKLIVPGITHWNHPRFFAYFSISASGPGILGEMLAAALNVNHMLWKTSPAATELEQVTLGWLRQWLGLPDDFFGIIHDTASIGSLHAILAARELAAPEVRLTGEHPPLVLYASEHAHSSIDRGALAAGIGLENIRHVPSDDEFRMRPDALASMIAEDIAAGRKPFCVVATVGTTSTTSVDSVAQIGEIATGPRSLVSRRRRLCRVRRAARRASPHSRRRGAGRFPGDESAQVAVHAGRSEHPLHPPSRRDAAHAFARRSASLSAGRRARPRGQSLRTTAWRWAGGFDR